MSTQVQFASGVKATAPKHGRGSAMTTMLCVGDTSVRFFCIVYTGGSVYTMCTVRNDITNVRYDTIIPNDLKG